MGGINEIITENRGFNTADERGCSYVFLKRKIEASIPQTKEVVRCFFKCKF